MITGDHPVTAAVIAAELGISDDQRAVTGVELDRMTEDERVQTVKQVSVYARVLPFAFFKASPGNSHDNDVRHWIVLETPTARP